MMNINQKQTVYYGKITCENHFIYIAATNKGLCYVGSPNEGVNELNHWINKKQFIPTLIEDKEKIKPYTMQLQDYLSGKRKSFDVPIDVKGTPFQEAVWNELKNIPYGKTVSYTDIANSIGNPTAVRAVGAAVGANPVLIVIPCHRVIAKNGRLTGFRGGISMKEKLLALENSTKIN